MAAEEEGDHSAINVRGTMEKESRDMHVQQMNAITDILNTREWLEALKRDQEVALTAENEKSKLGASSDSEDLEVLQERIADLESELFKVNVSESTKELLLKRIQFGQVLSDKMFSDPLPASENEGSEDNTCPDSRKVFEALLQNQSRLSSEVLHGQETVDELQKELNTRRKRNKELKKRNRQLMLIIEQHRQKREKMKEQMRNNPACRELNEELKGTVARVEIAKGTLRALIFGSGINWAQDPDLLEAILLCGEPLQL